MNELGRLLFDKAPGVRTHRGIDATAMERYESILGFRIPEEHREFLEFLHIPAPEIESIRKWSRG